MTNTIKLKRGSGSDPSASDMVVGEPVLRSDTAELFFKKDDGSVAKVSGGGGGGSSFQYLALRNAANDGAASYPGNDFTLVTSGTTTAVSPATANALILSYGGVVQKPNSGTSTSGITGFIVDGSRLKTATNFAAAPDFIVYQESGGIGEPSDNTVTEAKLNASNSPTNGYFLQAQSGNTGGLTWAAAPANDSSTGIDFDDNVKARWGTGNDLEAYFDGTHSKIVHTPGSGNAYLAADSLILSNAAMSEYYLTGTANGAVELHYDNSKKLETASDKVMFSAHAKVAANDTYDLGASGARWKDLYISNDIDISDNGKILLGTGDDLQLYHNGSHSYIDNVATGDLFIRSTQTNGDVNIVCSASNGGFVVKSTTPETIINAVANGAVELYYDGAKVLYTNTNGVTVHAAEGGDANLYLHADEGDDDVDKWLIQSESDGYFALKNNASGSYETSIKATGNGSVELYYDNVKRFETYNSSGVTGIKVYDNVVLPDDGRIRLGNATYGDLQIFHDGSNSYINHLFATGDLILDSAQNFYIKHSGENQLQCVNDGRVALYYDGANKMETISNGVEMHGSVYIKDNEIAGFGNISNPDLRIYHDSSSGQSIIAESGPSVLKIKASDFRLSNSANSADYIQANDGGAVKLYYNGSKKFETWSSGARLPSDNNVLAIGAGDDLRFWHNATNSIIRNATGQLQIQSNDLRLYNYNASETYLKALENGAVELYYNGLLSYTTQSYGGNVQSNGTSVYVKYKTSEGSTRGYIYANNNDEIGFLNPSGGWSLRIESDGDYAFSGSNISDRDRKDNITTVTGTSLDKITKLIPKTYNWKNLDGITPTDKTFTGFIAQEVKEHLPSLVTGTDGQKNMAVDYNGILAHAVKAITELSAEVETLKTKVAALEGA